MANARIVKEEARAKGSGAPLAGPGRARLARLAQLCPSEKKAAALLQVSDRTYCRALAGLGLRRGTRLLIETRLRELQLGEDRP